MPIVHVFVWSNFSNEAKKKTIYGVTNVFTDLGIPREAIEVIIHEVPRENWGIAGEQSSERVKDAKTP
ncbi:MAG: tautomerase family protein [Thermoplasmata archaeon]|nr:tautomerase family protein [Thermoplasmata archaeon]